MFEVDHEHHQYRCRNIIILQDFTGVQKRNTRHEVLVTGLLLWSVFSNFSVDTCRYKNALVNQFQFGLGIMFRSFPLAKFRSTIGQRIYYEFICDDMEGTTASWKQFPMESSTTIERIFTFRQSFWWRFPFHVDRLERTTTISLTVTGHLLRFSYLVSDLQGEQQFGF